jgi:hypothetical protein
MVDDPPARLLHGSASSAHSPILFGDAALQYQYLHQLFFRLLVRLVDCGNHILGTLKNRWRRSGTVRQFERLLPRLAELVEMCDYAVKFGRLYSQKTVPERQSVSEIMPACLQVAELVQERIRSENP